MKKERWGLVLIPLLLVLASCMGMSYLGKSAEAEYGYAEPTPAPEAKRMAAEAPAGGAVGESAPRASQELAAALSTEAQELEPGEPHAEPAARKRVYSGYCRLRVNEAEETKTRIADIAEESGGYVESVQTTSVVIRIPAQRFTEIFERILGLGDVDDKAIETYDVTEYFRDQETRLEIHRKTRERLYALLEKTEDVEERLAILREIKRLTEEIERIERTLELLERQISFSRITVSLIPRLPPGQGDRSSIPFGWIAGLDPLYPRLVASSREVSLELGEEFAVFEKAAAFRAESAEGTRVRLGATRNSPAGDTEFWRQALAYHLGPYFRKAEELELGLVGAVLFTSKDAKPYSYLVGVVAEEGDDILKEIVVVEVFFPDQNALGERLPALREAIGDMELR